MISVIIVNWNAGALLKNAVSSLQSQHLVDEIIVVDNGSTDNSAELVEHFEKIKLIRTGKNLGFAAACNIGANGSKSEYLIFLNPDATVNQDTLEKALAYMQKPENSAVGICGVQLIDEKGNISRSCAKFPSTSTLAAHTLGLDRILPKFGYGMSDWNHNTTKKVDHVIGAFYLIRRKIFEDAHGFDERFFVYLEDLDLSYRVATAGWSSVYLADVQAFHAGGGTSNQVKAKRLFYSLRSRVLYAFKHLSFLNALLILLLTFLVEPLSRSAYAIARGSWQNIKETWVAYLMLLTWLPRWLISGKTR
ncbi:hypothetical protein SAMN05216229_111148 [Geopseudomonas sagittaria]|uniref:Glycosyltransferase 2-like domain-containing protein n=1 Tax=Geopseudomonas sagittaria TaxID=1135990 RepID=A0A1I5VVN6_9GAMM|nr:glycosyltransferase family 2 protein [Pseudomonas sagittaria]SFQ11046.1 hypothetical protein SAMN05216229_111148 [Pseudomonas sagittaria]